MISKGWSSVCILWGVDNMWRDSGDILICNQVIACRLEICQSVAHRSAFYTFKLGVKYVDLDPFMARDRWRALFYFYVSQHVGWFIHRTKKIHLSAPEFLSAVNTFKKSLSLVKSCESIQSRDTVWSHWNHNSFSCSYPDSQDYIPSFPAFYLVYLIIF